MATSKENVAVADVERALAAAGRFHINSFGSLMSKGGAPDFITCDRTGRLVGIEVKRPGETPKVNQFRRACEMLISGARYIVAYEGFTIKDIDCEPDAETDNRSIVALSCDLVIGDTEFDLHFNSFKPRKSGAVELVTAQSLHD